MLDHRYIGGGIFRTTVKNAALRYSLSRIKGVEIRGDCVYYHGCYTCMARALCDKIPKGNCYVAPETHVKVLVQNHEDTF